MTTPCPCGSSLSYGQCCERIISGNQAAETAEALLRSRYTAYVKKQVDHILNTTHPDQAQADNRKTIEKWSRTAQWLNLAILDIQGGGPEDDTGTIEFKADYLEKGFKQRHHEVAEFKKHEGRWYFFDAQLPKIEQFVRNGPKIGRNDLCGCGSGKKYKKCCGK